MISELRVGDVVASGTNNVYIVVATTNLEVDGLVEIVWFFPDGRIRKFDYAPGTWTGCRRIEG